MINIRIYYYFFYDMKFVALTRQKDNIDRKIQQKLSQQ